MLKFDAKVLAVMDGLVSYLWQTFGLTKLWSCRIALAATVIAQMADQALFRTPAYLFGFALYVATTMHLHNVRVERLAKKKPEAANSYLLFMREGYVPAFLRLFVLLVTPLVVFTHTRGLDAICSSLVALEFLMLDTLFPMEPRRKREVLIPARSVA